MNIISLTTSFEESLINESDVSIELYCEGYKELARFLNSFGSIFSFVVSDVELKIGILMKLILNNSECYKTLGSMIEYEQPNVRSHTDSGCRTFLRLHRALKFLYLIFEQIMSNDDKSLKSIINESYDETLGVYHPWLIRKGVKVAVNFLPYKDKFVDSVLKEQPQTDQMNTKPGCQKYMTSRTVPLLKKIFICCEQFYTKNGLHDLS